MRIAHIITRMIVGGAQENTLLNCLDLVHDFGDEVVLVTGPSTGPEGALLEQGRAGGVQVYQIDALRREIHPRHDWTAYRQLRHFLQHFQPQVVHTHSAKGGFLGRLAAWRLGVPAVVHTVHGAPFHRYQHAITRKLFIHLERYAARHCHHLISVADAMTELMVDAAVAPKDKFTTIYSGMDVEPFQQCDRWRDEARRELGFREEHVVFGKVARLFRLKGHEYLIAAARDVVARYPHARFLLVGDGILRRQVERAIADAGLQPHFVLTGLVPPDRVPYFLSAMDVLVHTSLREGLARTIPQALISGRPVISFDIDGAREVVLNEQTGYLVPPCHTGELAAAMMRLAAAPEQRQQFGRQGARRFTDQFRHQKMSAEIRRLYQQILAQRR
ncbi:MAG: glycosyl transferase family 1 [Pirellulaceae bacterium]|nr:MAG: glycosyl transferase family 1 [Pirellulaceae bacterium]